MKYLYVYFTIIFAVISQLIVKWRMTHFGQLPEKNIDKLFFLIHSLVDPFIIISIILTLLSGLCWMAAMTKLDISSAYPFMSLSFILILILSSVFFNEPISEYKIVGLFFIIIGIFFSSK